MRKLSRKQVGSFRSDLLNMLSGSPDPFISVLYNLDIGPCKRLAKTVSAETGHKITLSHVFNKLLGMAIAENSN